MVKFTGGQRIDLLGIKKEDLPGVWADLGMPSGHAYTKALRTVKTCVGTEFCRYGTNDSTGLGIDLRSGSRASSSREGETRGQRMPAKLCRINRQGRWRDRHEGGEWEVSVGGAAGAHVRKTDVAVPRADEGRSAPCDRQVPHLLPRQREVARTHLRLRPAPGIEQVRDIIVNDSLGIGAQLDAEVGEDHRGLCRSVVGTRTTRVRGPVRRDEARAVAGVVGEPRPQGWGGPPDPYAPALAGGFAKGGYPMTATVTRVSLCTLDDIALASGAAFEVSGRAIAVFRGREGGVFAVDGKCPAQEWTARGRNAYW